MPPGNVGVDGSGGNGGPMWIGLVGGHGMPPVGDGAGAGAGRGADDAAAPHEPS